MRNKKTLILAGALLVTCLFWASGLEAQCPMCRMTAETNLANGGSAGRGLNAGIMYMLLMPYLLAGGVAYWWWKNRKSGEAAEMEEEVE